MRKRGLIWIAVGLFSLLFSVASSYLKNDAIEKVTPELTSLLNGGLDRLDFDQEKLQALSACLEQNQRIIPHNICHQLPSAPYYVFAVYHQDDMIYWDQNNYPIRSVKAQIDSSIHWNFLNLEKDIALLARTIKIDSSILLQAIDLRSFFKDQMITPSITDISFSQKPSPLFLEPEKTSEKIFINNIDQDIPNWRRAISSVFYIIGFFSLIIGLYLLLKDLIPKASVRITIFMVAVIFIEWLTSNLPIKISFDQSILTSPIFNSGWWTPSLLDLMVDIILLGAFVLLIINEIKIRPPTYKGKRKRYLFGLVHYFTLLGFLLFSAFAVRQMIVHSNAQLRIENLLQWDLFSIFLLGAIVIFISIIFLLSYYLHNQVRQLSFSMDQKLLLLGAASILLLPIYLYLQPGIHPFAFFIVAFIFAILLDLFTENVSGGLTWPFIWLSVFAGFTSLLIFTFSQDRLKLEEKHFLTSELEFKQAKSLYNASEQEFTVAQYVNGRRSDFSGNFFPKVYPFDSIPLQGQLMTLNRDKLLFQVYNQGNDKIRLTAHELSPITKPISLYSYLFVLWVCFTLVLLILNSWFNFLPKEWSFHWAYFPSLRKRIQYYILAVTVGSFLIISLVTYFYYINTTDNQFKNSILANTSKLRDDIESSASKGVDQLTAVFSDRKEIHRMDAHLYNESGIGISENADPMLPYAAFMRLRNNSRNSFIYDQNAFAPIYNGNTQVGILEVPLEFQNTFLLSEFDDLITTLLNVYVFLFVLASGLAVAISNSITAPLKVLSEKLKGLKLGKKNEPLEWENKDELGELIQDYNRMIQQLEESARILAATERETAWREMAKQVAHEIKNPLTPMKLSIQHLQFAVQKDGQPNEKLFQNVTRTLIEQIDNLNKIASEFSNFAKMPEPENEQVILNDVVASIHDLFRKREDMDINLFVPIDEISVFADKNHIMRVMNNLLKNAIQAIPTDRRGTINIELYKEDENAIISVEDNGKGIPKEVRNKVFKPNFTSKSSGTGLGLAICANIIEGFNGRIYFETKEMEGTTFFVEIPLMRMEDNFKERERVIL